MAQLSAKHKIINYFRYVDDILTLFDPNHSNIQAILADLILYTQNYSSQPKQKRTTQ